MLSTQQWPVWLTKPCRSVAITRGALPVRTWERSSS
jgi:hypothetical protein